MGKRKFKKPDDSESDYEWEEEKPNKQVIIEAKSSKGNDLDIFLNKISTKSSSEMRSEKIQKELCKETKLYEERLYKQTKPIENNFNSEWLRKSFYRCKEQAASEKTDIMDLLRDRYDERTVDFMIKNFGTSNMLRRRDEKRHMKAEGRRPDLNSSYEKKVELNASSHVEKSTNEVVEERYVVDADINEACASLLKAEMSGNHSKMVKLEKRVKTLREAQKRNLKIRLTRKKVEEANKEVVIQKSLKSGKMIPYVESSNKFISQSRPYDNDNSSIKDLLQIERAMDGDDYDLSFAQMSGKLKSSFKTTDDIISCEYNDVFVQKKVDTANLLKKEKQQLISKQKHQTAQVSNCKLCYNQLPKHLVLSKGTYFSLIVPMDLGITDYHLQLIPLDHIPASTHIIDTDAWDELRQFKKRLVEFFEKELRSETVFMETVTNFNNYPHLIIDCVPLTRSKDSFQVSYSVFFKKSIDEAKSEWCQNKKLLDLKNGDIRRTVPKGFPYFSVEFDLNGAYALVIEDEVKFPKRFGLEIAGSLLGKDMIQINNREVKGFHQQADAVLKYEKKWKKYDLWPLSNSDDDSD